MDFTELAEIMNQSAEFRGDVRTDEPMANRTTMRTGGRAPLLAEPADADSLAFAVRTFRARGAPYFVLGGGSNVIIADEPQFAVLSTKKINYIEENCKNRFGPGGERGQNVDAADGVLLTVGAGATWGRVCGKCRAQSLTGLEAFSGLPGTVGGALFMNATCFGFSACDALVSARYLDVASGGIRTYTSRAADWGYKTSPFQGGGTIVLEATFRVHRFAGGEAELAERYARAARERAAKGHFSAPSAGSAFKNDPARGIIAGKLIDECGLKGAHIGGARVADWHGNFIINAGGATAADIRALTEHVRAVVQERTGVALECEIIFAGE